MTPNEKALRERLTAQYKILEKEKERIINEIEKIKSQLLELNIDLDSNQNINQFGQLEKKLKI